MNPSDFGEPSDFSSSTTMRLTYLILTITGCIAIKFSTDTKGTLRINPNDFGNPLYFPIALPAGK